MARRRSVVVALTLLAVIAVAAIVCVIWLLPDRGGPSPVSTGPGISAVAGGISWIELYAIAGVGLAVCLGLAACVALLVSSRESSES